MKDVGSAAQRLRIEQQKSVCHARLLAVLVAAAANVAAAGPVDAVAAAITVPTATHGKKVTPAATIPEVLVGVWHEDDADGLAQCKEYKTLARSPAGTVTAAMSDYPPLLGSLVVGPHTIHKYAEMGEGDFFLVERTQSLGPGRWTFSTHLFIDGRPAVGDLPSVNDEPDPMTVGAVLSGDRLTLHIKMSPKKSQWDSTEVFRRCAPIDPRMYSTGDATD